MEPEALAASQPETNWLSADELRSWRAYIAGNQRLMDQMNKDLQAKNDMTLAEYRILILLSEAPGNSLRMSDLADGVLSSRSRLTHQINWTLNFRQQVFDAWTAEGRDMAAYDRAKQAVSPAEGAAQGVTAAATDFAKVDAVIAERASG